jgi:hypothetical protein
VMPGWRGTQRRLALETGYTVGGVNDALSVLRKLGILGVMRHRGRLGWTFAKLQRGVQALRSVNVRTVVERSLKVVPRTPSIERTFSVGAFTDRLLRAGLRPDLARPKP